MNHNVLSIFGKPDIDFCPFDVVVRAGDYSLDGIFRGQHLHPPVRHDLQGAGWDNWFIKFEMRLRGGDGGAGKHRSEDNNKMAHADDL